MPHLWVRAEERQFERRVGLSPQGAQDLLANGFRVTVEDSPSRAIGLDQYRSVGCEIAAPGAWRAAPKDTIIFGLKELTADKTPLIHRHIMFGHAYKGQADGPELLRRFKQGDGCLYDLEYLTDQGGKRVAAFGYWAGYTGAAVAVMAWAANQQGQELAAVTDFPSAQSLTENVTQMLGDLPLPSVLIIGALGRSGTGAANLTEALGISPQKWDMAETASGGPFPEILQSDVFLNCILARPDTPVFVPKTAVDAPRKLAAIGDIACDPSSDYNPIPLYDRVTDWANPTVRVAQTPPLDIMAIDNLPSLLPVEASEDFAAQLLPHLHGLKDIEDGTWARAKKIFRDHAALA